jgi:hypothetical protein
MLKSKAREKKTENNVLTLYKGKELLFSLKLNLKKKNQF